MFSMTDGLPDRESIEVGASVGEGGGPQVSAVLSGLDDNVRSLTVAGLVTDDEVRRVRRQVRAQVAGLGVCEVCRRAPAVRRAVFGNGGVGVVCTPCSRGAVGGVAA